jgi:hypothetical protein
MPPDRPVPPPRGLRWPVIALWLGLLALPFGVLGTVNGLYGPAGHDPGPACSRLCHDRGCIHTDQQIDFRRPVARLAREVYVLNIRALKASPLGYQRTNLVVYVLGFPLLNAGLLLVVLWPLRRTTGRGAKAATVAIGLGLAGLLVVPVTTGGLAPWGWSLRGAYWYCTDFCIHAANLTGVPYAAFNFLLFTVAFPLTSCGLATLVLAMAIERALGRRRIAPG